MDFKKKITAEELASNDDFTQWVLMPNDVSNKTWQAWLSENPNHEAVAEHARQLVLALKNSETTAVPTAWIDDTWAAIEQRTTGTTRIHRLEWRRWAAAAAFIGLVAFGGFWFLKKQPQSQLVNAIDELKIEKVETQNSQAIAQKILLADGSTVLLEPGGSLEYPTVFNGANREVRLTGEAFFDIKRDSAHPFLVFADGSVTRVLGTSFRVKTYGEDQVEVSVRTGKVAVFAAPKTKTAPTAEFPNDAVMLTPNQRVVFNPVKLESRKTLVETPVLLDIVKPASEFRFEEAPMGDIFKALSEAYGVEVKVENADLKNCKLTTVITDLPLYEKLDILCAALGVTYSKQDTSILIMGKGCN